MGMSFDKEKGEWMMIAEYLENGSLFDHIHKKNVENLPDQFIPKMIR